MNRRPLFIASCIALITTAMVFSIRSDILDALAVDFHLNREQPGLLLSPRLTAMVGPLAEFFDQMPVLGYSNSIIPYNRPLLFS